MPKLVFSDWFERQHGPRQRGCATGSVVTYSEGGLDMGASRGRAAQAELDRRRLWDEKHASALYAWQVDDK